MKVELKAITPNAEVNIVEIARVSSKREDKTQEPEKLINYLIKNKHWSPFEHSFMTVEITTSKAIAIQYLRHRSCTFQEFSQRYAEVENFEDIEFRLQAEKNRQSSTEVVGFIRDNFERFDHTNICTQEQWDWLVDVTQVLKKLSQLYKDGLNLDIAKESARMILPMCSQTTLYMTGSIRSWIHLLQLRDDPNAQREAQLIAIGIKSIFKAQCPIISKALNF